MNLPPYVELVFVQGRLALIFPDGTPNHAYCTRPTSAVTVFTMLYIGAVDGSNQFSAPKHIFKMGPEQAKLSSDAERIQYAVDTMTPGATSLGKAWYAENTRESIRDESIRQGLIPTGAVVEKAGVPTNSSKPRYALTKSFVGLFDPNLTGDNLVAAIAKWQNDNLTPSALARIAVLELAKSPHDILVTKPDGQTIKLAPGPSSIISKAVIEAFAAQFLETPGLLWLSESKNKVIEKDEVLARRIGLKIDASKNLPDIILVDVGGPSILLVFVEVVATDGPISEARRADLLRYATDAGIPDANVAFVTAFLEREAPALRKAFASLAWNSFVWVASEPENIIAMVGGIAQAPPRLRDLLAATKVS